MKHGFVNQSEVEWLDLGNGVSRQIYSYNDQVMMVRVQFQKGAVGTLHSHPHIQTTYVDSGTFEVTINGESQILHAGDAFMVLPDLVHGCVCKEEGSLIDVFVPMRADFI